MKLLRRALHRFVPAGFHDPIGLARRLLETRDPAALFALRAAALGPLIAPLDLLLTPFERAHYRRAQPPRLPVIVVCGCARSGTTVAAQLLMHRLQVSYFTNLTSVFPRSPLTAEAAFGRRLRHAIPSLRNFYGRTSGWSGPNDALYVWDRWLGRDRARVPAALEPGAVEDIARFFGAREAQTGLATLNKANALNVSAHLVAEALPTSRFICVERDRIPLALSLLKARVEIHGRADIPYGIAPDSRPGNDPVEDVCRQVLFHERVARHQLARLGQERFLLVRLEDIFLNPESFVQRVARDVLHEPPRKSMLNLELEIQAGGDRWREAPLAGRIEEAFERLSRDS